MVAENSKSGNHLCHGFRRSDILWCIRVCRELFSLIIVVVDASIYISKFFDDDSLSGIDFPMVAFFNQCCDCGNRSKLNILFYRRIYGGLDLGRRLCAE